MFTTDRSWSLSWARSVQSIPLQPIFQRSIVILSYAYLSSEANWSKLGWLNCCVVCVNTLWLPKLHQCDEVGETPNKLQLEITAISVSIFQGTSAVNISCMKEGSCGHAHIALLEFHVPEGHPLALAWDWIERELQDEGELLQKPRSLTDSVRKPHMDTEAMYLLPFASSDRHF
jgi:hypothetical protein